MGKKTALAAMAAAMLLALTLPFAAATTTAASLTLDGALRPGAVVTATLRLTGESISGVSFRLRGSDNVTVNSCYLLTPGWSLDSSGGRYAAHSASAPVQTLDIMVSLTAGGIFPGEASSLRWTSSFSLTAAPTPPCPTLRGRACSSPPGAT